MNIDVGIPNIAAVEIGIFRGGQPTQAGWDWLKLQGISQVVKLNLESEASDAYAKSIGMQVFYYPIDLDEQLIFRPKYELVIQAVNSIQLKTFVHCEHGEDRTGEIIGCYRVLKQGWSKDDAWAEMIRLNFHPELLGLTLFWEWAI